jgi:hypothetical protein
MIIIIAIVMIIIMNDEITFDDHLSMISMIKYLNSKMIHGMTRNRLCEMMEDWNETETIVERVQPDFTSIINHRSSIINDQLSVINDQSSIIDHQ